MKRLLIILTLAATLMGAALLVGCASSPTAGGIPGTKWAASASGRPTFYLFSDPG